MKTCMSRFSAFSAQSVQQGTGNVPAQLVIGTH